MEAVGSGFGDGVAGEGGSSSARPCRSRNVGDGIGQAAVIVATQTVLPIAQIQRPIQMLMHRHRAAGQGSCASARVRSASEDSQSSRCCRDRSAFRQGTKALPACSGFT
jgi:hypothetical protein